MRVSLPTPFIQDPAGNQTVTLFEDPQNAPNYDLDDVPLFDKGFRQLTLHILNSALGTLNVYRRNQADGSWILFSATAVPIYGPTTATQNLFKIDLTGFRFIKIDFANGAAAQFGFRTFLEVNTEVESLC